MTSEEKPPLPLTCQQIDLLLAEITRVQQHGFGRVTIIVLNGKVRLMETSISVDIRAIVTDQSSS